MAYKIVASVSFTNRLIDLNNYLENNWGLPVAKDFNDSLHRLITVIQQQPYIGSPSKKGKNIRRILVTKHNRLYYRVNENNTITLLALFDTRQNPNRNRYE